ncbi:MAG: hypothetical protein ACHQYQ_01770 [Bacteriovoracales bacterium]
MQIDVPVIFVSAFLIFFMGGFFFTYYAILWFENEARKEDEELGKLLKLPDRKSGKAFSKEKEAEEELAERKKVA